MRDEGCGMRDEGKGKREKGKGEREKGERELRIQEIRHCKPKMLPQFSWGSCRAKARLKGS
jgi:hypothetical protein